MRILLSWARRQNDPDIGILIHRLGREKHQVVYFVGAPIDEAKTPAGAVFHSYTDAGNAIPALGVDPSGFEPLGADIIQRLYRTESITLTMMNRSFDRLCVDERRRLYYEMVRYWSGVLRTFKPEAVIFPNMPHSIYDYLLYELAHLLGIKTILFDDTRFPGRLLPFTDFRYLTKSLQEEMEKNRGKQSSLNDLAPDIRDYYELRSRRDYNVTPSYIVDLQEKHSFHWSPSLKSIAACIQDLSVFRKAPRYIRWLLRIKGGELIRRARTHLSYPFVPDLRKEYSTVQMQPNLSRKFVYFPLQKQPERSTSPQGDMFVDQLLALQILSASVPKDWVIYVKEHPVQWAHFGIRFSSFRYRGYYKKIAQIKNVQVIPLGTSSYQLINNSHCVSAVTGSAGWEAVLRSKPAVIFGAVWYQDCPGIFKASSVKDCRQALDAIAAGFLVDERRLIHYLKCFDAVTIRGFIAPSSGKASTVSKEECMQNISRAIIRELQGAL